MEASNKAFKSAEKKTKQTLKDVATAASINKTRKTYWFEKFLWFISSENYLVIGGRDQQQNELIVKRYLRPGDLYVHADLHGASSCIIKNHTGEAAVPPKTLNEAGTMAICNSAAWDSKVVTSAWYVHHDQVSKTAPSGEYLTTGSFMIRGRKNYLPPSYLVYGFGFLFKLEESSIERHVGERRVRTQDEDTLSVTDTSVSETTGTEDGDVGIDVIDDSESGDDEDDENVDEGVDAGDVSAEEDASVSSGAVQDAAADDAAHVSNKIAEMKVENPKPVEDLLEFPDTNISLTHIKGDKYELHRDFGHPADQDHSKVYLGDGVAVEARGEKIVSKNAKVSAKQRRDMKKGKKEKVPNQGESDEEDNVSWLRPQQQDRDLPSGNKEDPESVEKSSQQQPTVMKRGQKAKLKKMKEKYADQDEEERRLRMDILASSGGQKEDKKKKGKKRQTTYHSTKSSAATCLSSSEVTGQRWGSPRYEHWSTL